MPRIMREVVYRGDTETMDIGGTQRDHDTYNRLAAQLSRVLPPGDLQDSILERQFEKGLRGDTPAQLINSLRREIENIDNLNHRRDDRNDGRGSRGGPPTGYEGDMYDMSDEYPEDRRGGGLSGATRGRHGYAPRGGNGFDIPPPRRRGEFDDHAPPNYGHSGGARDGRDTAYSDEEEDFEGFEEGGYGGGRRTSGGHPGGRFSGGHTGGGDRDGGRRNGGRHDRY